jgi:hypothetical protein
MHAKDSDRHPHPDYGRFRVDTEPQRPDPAHRSDRCSSHWHCSALTPPLAPANYPGDLWLEGDQPCIPPSLSSIAEGKIPHLLSLTHRLLAPCRAGHRPGEPSSSIAHLCQSLSRCPTLENLTPSSSPPLKPL